MYHKERKKTNITSSGVYDALSGKANSENFTLSSENPKSITLPYYSSAIFGGFAQGIGAVLIAIFKDGSQLNLVDLKTLSSFTNEWLSFSLSENTLTITTTATGTSIFTFIPLGY